MYGSENGGIVVHVLEHGGECRMPEEVLRKLDELCILCGQEAVAGFDFVALGDFAGQLAF